MTGDEHTTIKPLELLELLRGYSFLENYVLSLFYEKDGVVNRLGDSTAYCGALVRSLVCSDKCEFAFEKAVSLSLEKGKPMVFNCRAGLMHFAVPFQPREEFRYCFVGGGVRDRTIDIFLTEKLARSDKIDGFQLLEKLEQIPSAEAGEVKEAAREVFRLLNTLNSDSLQTRLLEKSMGKFRTIRGIITQIDRIDTEEELLNLVKDTIGMLFDVRRVAIALRDGHNAEIPIQGLLGLPPRLGCLTETHITALCPEEGGDAVVVPSREMGEFFPAVVAEKAVCLPLTGEGIHGILVLFDSELTTYDLLLVGMITDRITAKLVLFRKEETYRMESAFTGKFMSMLSTISATENRRELYDSVLQMAADMLQASSGSLMLIDESGDNLRIESVLGMNLQLARSMSARIGRGIAGKVAESGQPLLVKDIEQDSRVRIPNRSRFKTKSFVSIPLMVKGSVIGVLNLSDKKDNGVFTDEDLVLLTAMARHACVVLERTEFCEKAAQLEKLTVTDPSTGLFNRRFLEQRLEEELSRSGRQQLVLSVLLVDLDNFKIYNDLCGHAAGDVVLKKTARLLKNTARQMDTVTRFSGGRFCIILPGTPKKDSVLVGERIRREVERVGFTHEENLPLGRLTVSVGIASFPENGRDVESIIGSADVALHRAKIAGRNRVMHFDPSSTEESMGPGHHDANEEPKPGTVKHF